MKSLKDYSLEEYEELISHLEDELFSAHNLEAKIGAELEFYLIHQGEDEQKVIDLIGQKCDRVDKERGWRQYECILEYTGNLKGLATDLEELKGHIAVSARQNSIKAEFSPKPFDAEYGSALHLHLTLHDEYGINVFSANQIEDCANLKYVIAGLLQITPAATFLLSKKEEDFKRFHDTAHMAPTHISWGGNNRTTIIRIPDSKPKHRRIEFRLPHASSNPHLAIITLLLGALLGLDERILPPKRVHGNAFDEVYDLPKLPQTMEEAQNQFENNEKIAHYIQAIEKKYKTA
jgi:glutamine synthetase